MPDPVATPAAPATGTPAATPAAPAAPAVPAAAVPAATPAPGTTLLTDPKATPAQPAAAEEIKVTFPQGMEPDKVVLDKFVSVAREHKLTSAGAQAFIDLWAGQQQAAANAHLEMVTKWADEAVHDKEIGGPNWDKTLASAKRVLDRAGSPELKALLLSTGLGNSKHVIGFLAKLGNLIAEDRLPAGAGATPPGPTERDAALRGFFDKSTEMFERKG